MKRILFIVAGWHFSNTAFYKMIREISLKEPVDVFISSHKNAKEIGGKKLQMIYKIRNCRIQYFENVGFDWGMYSKAVNYLKNDIKNYEYIFFMHDDITIKRNDFMEKFINFLEQNNCFIVGNSKNTSDNSFHTTHPQVLEWAKKSKWNVEIRIKKWNTVRGSFFLARRDIFDKLKTIPYKTGDDIRFGNWSLIIFSGIVSDFFGKNSIKKISNRYLISPYILEYERGKKINRYVTNLKSYCLNLIYIFKKNVVKLKRLINDLWFLRIKKG